MLSRVKIGTHSPSLKKSHTTAHTAKQEPSLPRPQRGFALPVKFFYSATLLYTYISRFSVNPHYQQQFYLRPSFIAFFNLSHKWPTRRNRGCFRWGWYHYPRSVPHVSETLRGQGLKRRTLPLLGLGRECSRRTQKAFGTAMRLCVSLSRRRRGPAGLRDPVAIVSMIKNMINPWAGSFLIFCWANANSIKKVVLQPF